MSINKIVLQRTDPDGYRYDIKEAEVRLMEENEVPVHPDSEEILEEYIRDVIKCRDSIRSLNNAIDCWIDDTFELLMVYKDGNYNRLTY